MKLVALFGRHGETTANDKNLFRGPIDYDLNEKGRQQAKEMGDHLNIPFSAIFSSPKKRAVGTAKIALGEKVPIRVVPGFDSYNIGHLAGKPKNEENLKIVRYYQDNPSEVIPGGESLNQFRKDVDPDIIRVIQLGDETGFPTMSFVHSSIVHEVSYLLHGDHTKVKVRPGGLVGVFKNGDRFLARPLLKESGPSQDKDIGS